MKTKMIFFAALFFLSFNGMANTDPKASNETKKEDTAKIVETQFSVRIDEESDQVIVSIIGDFEKYSSVSIANTRGSEYRFSFIEEGQTEFVFNVNDLKAGTYMVILNSNEEIRMKRFQKK
jgi:hypothetical protein